MVAIDDPEVVRTSGKTHHPIVVFTGVNEDRVPSALFEITDDELAHADAYEVAAYVRVKAPLASGLEAWVYVDARQTSTRVSRRAFVPAPIGSKVVVHAGGDHIGGETRRVRDRRAQEKRRRAAAQIDIKIFDFRAPAGREFDFDAAAQRPASCLAAIVSGDE